MVGRGLRKYVIPGWPMIRNICFTSFSNKILISYLQGVNNDIRKLYSVSPTNWGTFVNALLVDRSTIF